MVATDGQILDAIRMHTEAHGYPPTVRELEEAVGIKSPSAVKYRLDKLRDGGLLTYEDGMARTIRLAPDQKMG